MRTTGSIAFLIVFLVIIPSSRLHAQEKNNLIKMSLALPLARTFEMSYERMLNDEMSIDLTAGAGELTYVNPQFRYYLTEGKTAPSGAFVAPFLMIREDFGGGLTIGYQQLYKQKVSLEAFLGPLVSSEVGIWGGVNVGIGF